MAKDPLPGSTSKGSNKTSAAEAEPVDFINSVDTTATRRADAHPLPALMQETTGQPPRRWDPSIIGFGSYHYTYASGCEGDAAAAGFSPRKANLVIYGLAELPAPDHNGGSVPVVRQEPAFEAAAASEAVPRVGLK